MFLVNSRLGLFSAACFQAPLIPKLRGNFAEFLNNPSPVGLRILSSSTCVGLRYGRLNNTYTFSRLITSHFATLISLDHSRENQLPVETLLSVSILNVFGGYGISTVCASATPFGLALAPAYPGRTNLPPETSDFRPLRFSRNSRYSFRHSLFFGLPRVLSVTLLLPNNAPLPRTYVQPKLRLYA